jgi:hypothetical protein
MNVNGRHGSHSYYFVVSQCYVFQNNFWIRVFSLIVVTIVTCVKIEAKYSLKVFAMSTLLLEYVL